MMEREEKTPFIEKILNKDPEIEKEIAFLSSMPSPSCGLDSCDVFRSEFIEKAQFGLSFLIEAYAFCDPSRFIKRDSWVWQLNVCAKAALGQCTPQEGAKAVKDSFFKLLLICVALTRLLAPKKEGTIVFWPPFRLLNTWKYFDLTAAEKAYWPLKQTLFGQISLVPALAVLESNLKKEAVPPNDQWLDDLFSKNPLLKTLDYPSSTPSPTTFEESVLLECASVRYEPDGLHEQMNFGSPWPDVASWKEEDINAAKRFFNNRRSSFLFDLILNIQFGRQIPPDSMSMLAEAVESFLENKEKRKLIPRVVLFALNSLSVLDSDARGRIGKASHKATEAINDVELLFKYEKAGFPLSTNAKKRLAYYCETKKKKLLNSQTEVEFLQRLGDEAAFKEMNEADLQVLGKQFRLWAKASQLSPNVYISYEAALRKFLLPQECIDHEAVKKEIIAVLWMWQTEGFKEACKDLKTITTPSFSIDEDELVSFSNEILKDPRAFFFGGNLLIGERSLAKDFDMTSHHPTSIFTSKIILRPDFPRKSFTDNIDDAEAEKKYKSGSFEHTMFQYFKSVRDKYSYRFLNPFNTAIFLNAFLESTENRIVIASSFFRKRKELYAWLRKRRRKASLCRYQKTANYAFLAQLFPILEDEILKYGATKGVVPLRFEEDESFGKRVQPQSVLASLIRRAFKEYQTLEAVGDLVWIYFIMYSDDGMNIRNNVIHGCDYPLSSQIIDIQFTITLLCLCDLVVRNDMQQTGRDGLFED